MDGDEHLEQELQKRIDDRFVQTFRKFESHIFDRLDAKVGDRLDTLNEREYKLIMRMGALQQDIKNHEEEVRKMKGQIEAIVSKKFFVLMFWVVLASICSAIATLVLLNWVGLL